MTVDYDVVVIGGTKAARHAAIAAAQLQSRVALVEPHPPTQNWLGTGLLTSQVVNQAIANDQFIDISLKEDFTPNLPLPEVKFASAVEWVKEVVSTLEEQTSPSVLASLGIDVLVEDGEFCRRPHLAFIVKNRYLRARTYLIATGSRPALPTIEGLQEVGYLTPAEVWQQSLSPEMPAHWVVIGGGAVGTEIAQIWARLGVDVTLVTKNSQIIPQEDLDVAGLVQAQLEADGVRVITHADVTQVKRINSKKWVLAGNRAIEADEIVLATGQQPNVETLNLEGVGVEWNPHGIRVNKKLQTTNPRIYACGSVIGGCELAHIADYEARIALKNALFLPVFPVDYQNTPWGIFSNPPLARVGLTEVQARRQYGKDVWVSRQYFKTLPKALLVNEMTGLCKIIARSNGKILGASIVGAEANELIHAIALAMRHGLKVSAIAQLPMLSPSFSEIVQQTAHEWNCQRLNRNKTLQNFLEGWFNWRRSSSS